MFFSSIICDSFETTSLPTVKTYPIDYNIVYYSVGITCAFTTIISGLFPALKASKVDPVEIIRGK
jgi:lipoprotein-releasing system permease protein